MGKYKIFAIVLVLVMAWPIKGFIENSMAITDMKDFLTQAKHYPDSQFLQRFAKIYGNPDKDEAICNFVAAEARLASDPSKDFYTWRDQARKFYADEKFYFHVTGGVDLPGKFKPLNQWLNKLKEIHNDRLLYVVYLFEPVEGRGFDPRCHL